MSTNLFHSIANIHIRGECNAGVTLQTARKPIIPARARVVVKFMKAGPVNLPRAKAVPIPPEVNVMERTDSCQGVKATTGCCSIFSGCTSGIVAPTSHGTYRSLSSLRCLRGNCRRRSWPEYLALVCNNRPPDHFVLQVHKETVLISDR